MTSEPLAEGVVETPREASAGGPRREAFKQSWWERNRRSVIVWTLRTLTVVAFLIVWELVSGTLIDDTFLSKPTLIWERLIEWVTDGTLSTHTWITLQEIILGFILGTAIGAVLAFVLGTLRLAFDVLDPLIMALYAIPKVALAPLFIVWFGIGLEMKVMLAAVSVFFLVFINTAAGIRDVDRGIIDAVRLMGASQSTIVRKVLLPASMTGLMVGLKVAIPYALIGAVIGELVASNQGLGFLVNSAASQFDTAGVFAAIFVLTIVAAILNGLVGFLERRINKWKPVEGDE